MSRDTTSLQALGRRRVRWLREGLRPTQEEFARRCGISVSFASLLERGERSPPSSRRSTPPASA